VAESALERLGAKVRAAVAGLPPSELSRAGELLDEAGETLYSVAQGSNAPELDEAIQGWAQARETVDHVLQTCDKVRDLAYSYLGALGLPSGPAPLEVKAATHQLGPRVPPRGQRRRGAPRVKTRGNWVDAPDSEDADIVSGSHDKYYDLATEHARRTGLAQGHIVNTAADVELKFARKMAEEGIADATLVLNNTPCEGELGCDVLLPWFLRRGSTLTIYGPDGYFKIYRGESDQ
jgi:hypothetical protein